jgi:hypothetical protein
LSKPAERTFVEIAANVSFPPLLSSDTTGPFRSLATRVNAAALFYQTGHSCNTQHFHVPDGCRAGLSRPSFSAVGWERRRFL